MIPHVQLPGRPPFGQERSAFARGPKERELRVVIDRATAPPGDALELLLGFGHHPLIDLLSTRDEGLPYLDIGPIDQQEDLAPVMISRPDGSLMDTGVWPAGQWQEFAQRYLRERPDLGDYDEILRALLLGAASEDYGADALVTASPVLIDPAIRGSVARDSNAMPVEAALALVGLYLRTPAGGSVALAVPRPLGEPRRPVPPDHWACGDALGDLGAQPGRLVDRGVGEAGQAPDVVGELGSLLVVVPAPDQGGRSSLE